ncbi:MAG: OsmC family protein [Bacteroidales bacterium]|jgi:putative redox protein|nr:OsmC family protein [Bacteroidales bacterium]
MAIQSVNVEWTSGMVFKADANGFRIMLDADEKVGGTNQGPRPKSLLLTSLGGCTGMDVVSILKKMRIEPEYFNIRLEGEVRDEHPKSFTRIHLIYEFRGKDLPLDKLQKAISLSQEKYCGIFATLRNSVELTTEIKIIS